MPNKLIDRTIPIDVGGVMVAVRLLSYRESMQLKSSWESYLALAQRDETTLGICLEIAIENFGSSEVLDTFTQTEIYELIGRAFKEAALTGIERKKPLSSPTESAEKSAADVREATVL